jgi:hypothetical protein
MRQRIMVISIMCSKEMSSGSVDSQNFVGSVSPFGHSMISHSSGSSAVVPSPAACTLTRAKRETSRALVPSRQPIVRQARFGRLLASSAAVVGSSSPRSVLRTSVLAHTPTA